MTGFWHSTCTALRDGREPGWTALQHYREPLMLLVRSRDPTGDLGDAEDVVHEILLKLKEKLYERYDSSRGRFRNFLCGVVRTELLNRWKAHRRLVPLTDVAEPSAPTEEEGAALDLVAEVLDSLQRWHQRFLRGPERNPQRIYVVAGRLIRGLGNKVIAEREGISLATVKRILADMRDDVLGDILCRTITLDEQAKAGLDWRKLGRAIRDILARPGSRDEVFAGIADPLLRRALQQWLDSYEGALRHLPDDGSSRAGELKAGLEMLFDES